MASMSISDKNANNPFFNNFKLKGEDVSIVNALRRTCLSNIPNYVMKEEDINITVNTTRFNNEILKQRIQCIPVHVLDTKDEEEDDSWEKLQVGRKDETKFGAIHPKNVTDFDSIIITLDKTNTDNKSVYVTTKDLKIKVAKNSEKGEIVNMEEVKLDNNSNLASVVFPEDQTTKKHIVIARLKPPVDGSNGSVGESLQFTAKISLGTAKENGSFNVVSTCAYENVVNDELSKKGFSEQHPNYDEDKDPLLRANWDVLDGKREKYCEKNEFNFYIETVGVYSNFLILKKACKIMRDRCRKFIGSVEGDNTSHVKIIHNKNTTQPLEFCATLYNEDYTLGNPLIHFLFEDFYDKPEPITIKDKNYKYKMTFVGFKVPHPHIDAGVIRIIYENMGESEESDEIKETQEYEEVEALEANTKSILIKAAGKVILSFENLEKIFPNSKLSN